MISGWSGPLMVTEIRVREKAAFGSGRPIVLAEEVVAEGPNGIEVRLIFAPGHGWSIGDDLDASVTLSQSPPPGPVQPQIPLLDLTD